MKMPGMYSCREVHALVGRGTVEDLGPWGRFRFRTHLAMCRHCARYVRQVRALGAALRRRCGREPDPERCRRLEEAVMARCDGHEP
ncbi:MAG: zf-HC2 domain-containing protein [Candidatus Krumholzibacteriia bacterium]